MKHLLRQREDGIRLVLLPLPVRTDAGIGAADILLLFEVGQVLPVADGDAVVSAPLVMEDGAVAVILPLAAEGIDDRAFFSEEQSSQIVRLLHLEGITRRCPELTFFREGERVRLGCVGLETRHGLVDP